MMQTVKLLLFLGALLGLNSLPLCLSLGLGSFMSLPDGRIIIYGRG